VAGDIGTTWRPKATAQRPPANVGSNEMNVAYIMLQPRRDFGIVMMTNVGGKKADQAMIALGENLYRRFFPAH
jgi:hypothetical protein